MWHDSHRIDLITEENEVVYSISPRVSPHRRWFPADFVHKLPLAEVHFDEKDQIIAILPARIFTGKFGPGSVIT